MDKQYKQYNFAKCPIAQPEILHFLKAMTSINTNKAANALHPTKIMMEEWNYQNQHDLHK